MANILTNEQAVTLVLEIPRDQALVRSLAGWQIWREVRFCRQAAPQNLADCEQVTSGFQRVELTALPWAIHLIEQVVFGSGNGKRQGYHQDARAGPPESAGPGARPGKAAGASCTTAEERAGAAPS